MQKPVLIPVCFIITQFSTYYLYQITEAYCDLDIGCETVPSSSWKIEEDSIYKQGQSPDILGCGFTGAVSAYFLNFQSQLWNSFVRTFKTKTMSKEIKDSSRSSLDYQLKAKQLHVIPVTYRVASENRVE